MRPGAETLAGTGQAPPSGAQEGALGAGLPPGVLAIGGQPSLGLRWPPSGSGCLSPEGEGLQPAISVLLCSVRGPGGVLG